MVKRKGWRLELGGKAGEEKPLPKGVEFSIVMVFVGL